MGLVCPELTLDLKPSYVPETINGFLKEISLINDPSERSRRFDEFLKRLEDEMKKIKVFKRELPLSMLLLEEAILHLKQESKQYKTRITHQLVSEEFIPLNKDSIRGENTQSNKTSDEDSGSEMKNWMRSFQLWVDDQPSKSSVTTHMSCNQNQNNNLSAESKMVDEKRNPIVGSDVFDPSKIRTESKGFVPLVHCYPTTIPDMSRKVENKEDGKATGLSLLVSGMIKHPEENSIFRGFDPKLGGAQNSSSPSAASGGRSSQQQISARKQRRCWSPELHRRFVDALTELGGAQVATPKQIRELMRVDGLTNDEVKSHLQKYRLHTRRVPNDSGKKNGQALSNSWSAQDQYSESLIPSNSPSSSPEGPLQFPGLTGGTSTTGGDSMEDDDDEKSEIFSYVHRSGNDLDKWKCPPRGIIKVNVDGAFSHTDDKHGIGFVARSSEGHFLLAGSKTLWGDCSAEIVEAKAVLWALDHSKLQGWRINVMVESDCKLLIEALNGARRRQGLVQTVIDNCSSCVPMFTSVAFLFCPRLCNGVAHRLAKWAGCGLCDTVWDIAPAWLADALYSDSILSES